MEKVDYCIIGGGWAGILTALELLKYDKSSKVLVLEKDSYGNRGGLLHSEIIKDFTFDTSGPHILFSRNKSTLSSITSYLGENVRKMERRTYVNFNGEFIDYPFENGIYKLSAELRAEIGEGIIEKMLYLSSNPSWKPANFRQWMTGFFGKPMAEMYLEPYNRKIWKRELENMSADWVFSPGRLPFPELKEIVKSISGTPSTGYAEQAYFFYPKFGGILALYDSVLNYFDALGGSINFGEPVRNISHLSNKWVINEKYLANTIVNTLPLNLFMGLLRVANKISLGKLDYNRVIVVGIAKKGNSPPQHSIYVPNPDIIFHRYTWMDQLTEDTPQGYSNLIAEITVPWHESFDTKDLEKRVIDDLVKIKVLNDKNEVKFSKVWVNEFGYPIYDMSHLKERERIMVYLNSRGIYSVGRWGSWQYWNTDKVYEAVMSIIDKILKRNLN